jgi:ubiquinone/menaquinone biosynthesis C-methylase UbiE
VSKYHTGWYAQHYNKMWSDLIEISTSETLAMVDFDALYNISRQPGRRPRVLDIACGTGILLKKLYKCIPDIEAHGVDASEDMLAQARFALKGLPNVQLKQMVVRRGVTAGLPYLPHTFDLITCTNALHYISHSVEVLAALGRLLAPGGYLIVEDYSRPDPPFPWSILEWVTRQVAGQGTREHTMEEAEILCQQAGLQVTSSNVFIINWLWRGWVLRLSVPA